MSFAKACSQLVKISAKRMIMTSLSGGFKGGGGGGGDAPPAMPVKSFFMRVKGRKGTATVLFAVSVLSAFDLLINHN